MTGTLYIVATPIGNLEDITLRALDTFKSVDLIACEDTRRTKILLERHKINKPLISFHQHSKLQKVEYLISELSSGKNTALVTDAGTPGISDPGRVLVAEAIKNEIPVVPIPGASALTALVSVSGVPMDRFSFFGFLPHKKGRETAIKRMVESDVPVIFYESPHRILKTLEALKHFEGKVIVGRELTKKFEEIVRGTAKEAHEYFKDKKIQGEFVVIYHS
ncbi:MAG: 16S rRNA (cytidine(1402)-2'-O)-methyltransferase [Candidatus Doudnabacteria bacterium CG10_big_fil_rev_8_21_14_0_10_41_10]|uniref:Ribosomal RNA small subunit methyltransferase I n=1 Tax=Candidatus Doudnabacteria bacterium CG10_big_fil_rev_8_21_14_0_10_41_10 TaxID=1974551 RepID=A0A2H0VDB1_9BACT|nr:MAG: 16S rRNA (cytidine(1402)-2'-O)-methyltransferase [Candidatus Doudnabacteria bacterium CG10_big_fil_rev_8_21_14_0_10_41_10]